MDTLNTLHYLIFDLDDTLLDTSSLLIPAAVRKSCVSMIQKGFPLDVENCVNLWSSLHKTYSGFELYFKMVDTSMHLTLPQKLELAKVGFQSFLNPFLPEVLPVPKEVVSFLDRLFKKYTLFLVTQGFPEIQKEKIRRMNIATFFKEIFIVDSQTLLTKKQIFENLLKTYSPDPLHFLSIGNRLRHEIAMAKQVGMLTCHIKQGEHKDENPQNSDETADWTIHHLLELESICK